MFHYPCLLAESGRGSGDGAAIRHVLPPKVTHCCHLRSKMPHSGTICRILHFGVNWCYFLSAFKARAVTPIFANKSAPRCLRHFLEVEHYSTLRGESWSIS